MKDLENRGKETELEGKREKEIKTERERERNPLGGSQHEDFIVTRFPVCLSKGERDWTFSFLSSLHL